MKWLTTARGFYAFSNATRYTITKYRTIATGGFVYVLRINGSAETSPAVAYLRLADAKARATALDRARVEAAS